jgi:competence protein ComEC
MARFHILSPAGLILNLLLIPVLAAVVVSGMGVLAFGWWLPSLASAFGWLCDLNLAILENTVKWAAHVPGARFWVAGPSDVWLIVFYLAVAAAMFIPRWLPPLRWRIALLGGWCGVGLIGAAPLHVGGDTLRCNFVAVGHGGAALLELPSGRTLLYDAGRLGSPSGGAQSISHYLWSRNITHVDAVVLSHADSDHYYSLPELLERFSVGVVYVSPVMFKDETSALKLLRESIEHSGAAIQYAYAGDRLDARRNATVDVLLPPLQGMPGRDNASSIVLAVEFAGKRILLTGDLEPPGSQALMNELPLHCDVLLAPHHGSAYSVPDAISDWATPNWVIIAGRAEDGRVSRPIYEAHGATVWNTADRGAISVTVSPNRFTVDCFHPDANHRN